MTGAGPLALKLYGLYCRVVISPAGRNERAQGMEKTFQI